MVTRAPIAIALFLLLAIPASSWAGAKTCIIGTDPEVAGDVAQIAALEATIGMQCPCFDFDGSAATKSHGAYVRCARNLIRAAVTASQLRSQCRGVATKLHTRTACGFAAADDRHPCIEERVASGAIRCVVKPLSRCTTSPGLVNRAACTAIESCEAAADDNGNFLFDRDPSGGDDAACAHADPIVRFVAVGDTGKGNAGQVAVAAGIEAKCAASGCDFVQFLGDNIYESGVTSTIDPQWQTKFETPYQDIVLPFYVVLGNHDYGGNGSGNEFFKGQNEVDYSQVSPKWKLPAPHYRRTWRHVEFFGLDTNLQNYGMDAQQRLDVAGWLASSTATWRIALGHHPYLSNGPHGNAGNYDGVAGSGNGVKSFFDTIVCGNADVYLSGHDHSMQWLTPTCAGTELIVSGAGASPTSLPGANANYYQNLGPGFAYVVIDGNTFTADFCDATGATLFSRSFSKP